MTLRKPSAKRLKVSTGDDRVSGATSSYVRKTRKAQEKASIALQPKTDEEKRLEEQLFGLDYSNSYNAFDDDEAEVPPAMDWLGQKRDEKLKMKAREQDFEEDEQEQQGLSGLTDSQLFFSDAPGPSSLAKPVTSDETVSDEEEEVDSQDADSEENDDDSHMQEGYLSRLRGKGPATGKKPLWHDPADANLTVSLQDSTRLRKLRTSASEDVVSGPEYENRLRQQFRKIHPTPTWAEKARQQKLKGPSVGSDDDPDDNEEADAEDAPSASLQQILQDSSAGIRKSRQSRSAILAGELEVTRLRDANQVDKANKSPITALQFHKSASVLYTTSEDRRLKLYQVDGSHNPLLQSVHLPELPISSAAFHPSGSSILMTGPRPFFYSYDLQAGRVIRSPRGLWSSGLGGSDGATNDKNGGSMEMFRFSPDGRMVAVAGRRGYVHLLDWGTDGKGMMAGGNGGQVVGQIKINTGIKGLSWNSNGTELVTVGDDANVASWDIGTRKCIQRWSDDGGFAPSCVETDRAERYFAIGSHSGIVNVYDSARSFSPDLTNSAPRKPLKSIMNLATHISTIRFNHSSEMMAIASKSKKDSLKLVHLPSLSIFSNWPTSGTPLGHVSAVDFSRKSEYVAIGNHKGRVLLYSVGHYAKA